MLSCFNLVRLCDTMNCSLSDSSVHLILQARILSGLPFPSPNRTERAGILSDHDCAPSWSLNSVRNEKLKHTLSNFFMFFAN